MFGKKLINTNAGGGCTDTVDLYNPFPDGGGVALYQLNGDATDVSGNYDGTATNVTYGAGEFGQAASFQNSNSRIILPNNVDASLEQSVSIWVKPTLVSYSFPIYLTKNGWGINVYIPSDGAVELQACRQSNGTQITYFGSPGDVVANNWYNFVITRSLNQASFYINSQQVATINYDGTIKPNDYSNTIGNFAIDGYNERGLVDQVRIFNRVLRPYEVEALYTEEYCTPTIVPSEHFNTITYSGDGQARSFTGVGFQPDLVWFKNRNDSFFWHTLWDSVRGPAKDISSNVTAAENTNSSRGYLTSFDPDGMSVVPGSVDIGNMNAIGNDVVAWTWKAGGAAVLNEQGDIDSYVSANTEAGFSIVSYTGVNSLTTVGHGLNDAPKIMIFKNRDDSDAYPIASWIVYSEEIGNTKRLDLNTTNAASTTSGWNNTSPTNSVFTINAGNANNGLNDRMIAYCFAEVEGFSNFGSYNGSHPTRQGIVTGFEPAFVMIKSTNTTKDWVIFDNKRFSNNQYDAYLAANTSAAEAYMPDLSNYTVEFLENGFSVQDGSFVNLTGTNYIYMAFAADPTTIEPTLEDSFNTVLYTGNGGTQTIGGVFEGGGSFNGSSSKIEIGSVISNVSDTTDFSFSQWLNFSALPTSGGIMGILGSSNANLAAIRIAIKEISGQYELGFLRNFNNTYYYSNSYPTVSLNNNSWYNLVFTYVASTKTVKCFLNGSKIGEYNLDQSAVFTVDGNLTLGAYTTDHPARSYNGSIDQVRIFNTALTAEQVTELYEETDADSSVCDFPSGAGAVALYELNGNANDTCGTYNGTASNVTWLNNGVGFQPDFVWIKERSSTSQHTLSDSVRGAGNILLADVNDAELTGQVALTSFDNNGFTVGNDGKTNQSGQTYTSWNWKASEIPAINSNGSINSVVSANPAAGFSIVSYTGNNTAGATIGHGLGVEPNVVIVKNRNTTDIWTVQHSALTYTDYIDLSSTNAATTNASVWYAQPTKEVFSFGANPRGNGNGNKHIAYCFSEIPGFSKFSSYVGTTGSQIIYNTEDGTAGGANGFEPEFLIIKCSSAAESYRHWFMLYKDGSSIKAFHADDSVVEFDQTGTITFNSNGFTIDCGNCGEYNQVGQTYIYMAFANQF